MENNEQALNAKVNDRYAFGAEELLEIDWVAAGDGRFHGLYQRRGYQAELLEVDMAGKHLVVRVNGNRYEVKLADVHDQMVERLGLAVKPTLVAKDIKAPMPGLVLSLLVQDGQSVKAGESLLILEAMKMENLLKAPGDGVIKRIRVKKGDAVEKNQLLIELD